MTERCSQCGKEIAKGVIPRVFDDRVVCLQCWRRLDSARQAPSLPIDDPPTERQLAYACGLGIVVPSASTKKSLSGLIEDAANPRLAPDQIAECHALGIAVTPDHRKSDIDTCLRDRQRARTWVYSVCRHLRGANWLQFHDS